MQTSNVLRAPLLALILAVDTAVPASSAGIEPALIARPVPAATSAGATPEPYHLEHLQVDELPASPAAFRIADLDDCYDNDAVRAVAGGDPAACRDRLNAGAVIATWDAYDDRECTAAAACTVSSFALYDYFTHERVATAGADTLAIAIPGATLGKCYVVRVQRRGRESGNSRAGCVTVLRTTVRAAYGPAETGAFQAIVHDNHDHDYCTHDAWAPEWMDETWGFTVNTRVTRYDPNVPPTNENVTIGWLAVDHPGHGPFPCRESLLHVWRGYLTFRVLPAEPGSVTHAVLSFDSPTGHANGCFLELWHAHHWYYKDASQSNFSATIGHNDGRILDAVNPYGPVTVSGTHVTFDLSGNTVFLNSGFIEIALALPSDGLDTSEIAHPTPHEGRYLHAGGSAVCAAKNPRIDIVSVRTQSTAVPAVIRALPSTDAPVRPNVERATPAPPEVANPRTR